jgi:hypothetical protein
MRQNRPEFGVRVSLKAFFNHFLRRKEGAPHLVRVDLASAFRTICACALPSALNAADWFLPCRLNHHFLSC